MSSAFASRTLAHCLFSPGHCRPISSGMARTFFIGGNWKSNGTLASVDALVQGMNAESFDRRVQVVVSPVELHIRTVKQSLNPQIEIAAQNASATGPGAYTGETSAATLKDFGVNWVILGHSERRTLFHETDEIVAKKLKTCLAAGMKVIACVGETLEQRKSGKTFEVVGAQIDAITEAIGKDFKQYDAVVIAYEPVWSIGTGLTASPAEAEEVHAFIRDKLSKPAAPEISESTRIIYGGSVKPDNCTELMKKENIDGFLVGGASLNATSFAKIANAPISAKRL